MDAEDVKRQVAANQHQQFFNVAGGGVGGWTSNTPEQEAAALERIRARDEQEMRLRCIQTAIHIHGLNTDAAINAAQKLYDFITGKRALSEVASGV